MRSKVVRLYSVHYTSAINPGAGKRVPETLFCIRFLIEVQESLEKRKADTILDLGLSSLAQTDHYSSGRGCGLSNTVLSAVVIIVNRQGRAFVTGATSTQNTRRSTILPLARPKSQRSTGDDRAYLTFSVH
ncbi:hypothetical protein RRG08_050199 [Elysia crispata]|uniref:Uncharacterized protein n=1 Tax=Elysia crispata TaxID=231223 RepID=A0AAE0Z6W7_9GAST|nr:hypothetical protein RRG08_050199 [Elysia crispata]